MQRVGDRARAVVAVGDERAVAAAVHVGARGDFVGGRDHTRDDAFGARGAGARGARAAGGGGGAPAPGRAGVGEVGGVGVQDRQRRSAECAPRGGAGDAIRSRPWAAWKWRTAASVEGPNSPSPRRAALPEGATAVAADPGGGAAGASAPPAAAPAPPICVPACPCSPVASSPGAAPRRRSALAPAARRGEGSARAGCARRAPARWRARRRRRR